MEPESGIEVLCVDWAARSGDLLAVRRAVFVEEQGVPEDLEIDEHDPDSLHFLALAPRALPVGTARLLPSGRIGRVAVLAPWRRRGVGRTLMKTALAAASARGDAELLLHAQEHSIPFYESLGFIGVGPMFDEAGIPHREMRRHLGLGRTPLD